MRRGIVAAAVALLVAAAVIAGVVWVRRTQDKATPQAAIAPVVVLEAAGDAGVDPFITFSTGRTAGGGDAVGATHLPDTGGSADITASLDPATGIGSVAGSSRRLYAGSTKESAELFGGSGILSACDPSAVAAFLAEHPDKSAAWAAVLGIDQSDISRYLTTLTPVVLLHDTLVTNHGFADGVAVPRVAVLQAGTGVLVDDTGLPVVRCACGNPLSAPPAVDLNAATVQGVPWDGYRADRTIVVTVGDTVSEFVAVDLESGEDITITVGGAGSTPQPSAAATTAPATGSTPSTVDTTECTLDLAFPVTGPGWIEADDDALSCQEMIDVWRRNEQWPGERGGTLALANLDDTTYCVGPHQTISAQSSAAGAESSLVGRCTVGDQSFQVYLGAYGQRTSPSDAAATPPSASPVGTPPSTAAPTATVSSDVFLTPSENIRCARLDNSFACTIQDYDFDIGPRCQDIPAPFVRLDDTGTPDYRTCMGDFFSGVPRWPDPTPYGTTVQVGGIACDVEQTGVTCMNRDGHGFTLSRAAYAPF